MSGNRLVNASERWFRLLLLLYPADFREEMGDAMVEAYRDNTRAALNRGGLRRLAFIWIRVLADSLRNGLGERIRPAVWWRRRGNWGRDAELAMRRLRRAPALAAAMVTTLAVGLGMFAVVYTFVQKILIEAMPYKDPDGLYFVWRDYGPILDLKRGWLGGTDVTELQKAGGIIEATAGLQRQLVTFSAREGMDATEIPVMVTSPNLFELLGVAPMLGRGFVPSEVGPGRPSVIVLTHELWNRLGADPAIVGTEVRLNSLPYTVIGVMPPSFAFVENASLGPPQRADAYTTFGINLAETNPGSGTYAGVIRARHAASPHMVTAAVDVVGKAVDARDFRGRGLKLYPVGLKSDLVSGVRPALLVLTFAGVFLVLVLMVNVSSVLLAQAAQREHEFAVSRALGANGAAVVRATVFEGCLLGLAGGVSGALAAIWGTRLLVALAPLNLPRREAIAVDWSIGAGVVGLGIVLGLLAATPPAMWAARTSLSSLLASSAVRGGGGHRRMRRGLIVAQMGLSVVLLNAGGLVVRSFGRLLGADPGFKTEGILTVRVPMPARLVPQFGDVLALQDQVQGALASLPGVTGVSAADALPLTASASQTTITMPAAPGNTGYADRDSPLVDYIGIRANYVEVMGMRLLSGVPLQEARRENVKEALIDDLLASQFFPAGNPIGAKIPFRDGSLTVVGVVGQARLYDVHQDGRPQLFIRAEDWGYRNMSFVLRSRRESQDLIPEVRTAIRRIDPRLALADVRTMNQIVGDALRQQRISAVLIAGFALGALLLAAMGLFGIVSNSVTRRRHELAVRLALGADHHRVLRLVRAEGVQLVGMGVLIGMPGVYLAGGVLRGILVGVSPWDPLTLLAVTTGLAIVAMAACHLSARRVLRIDPARSLRQE